MDKTVKVLDRRLYANIAENRERDERFPNGRKLCERCGRRWTANRGRVCVDCLNRVRR